jgi:hypothetical protein
MNWPQIRQRRMLLKGTQFPLLQPLKKLSSFFMNNSGLRLEDRPPTADLRTITRSMTMWRFAPFYE